MRALLTTLSIFTFLGLYCQPTVSLTNVISTGLTNPLQVVNAGDGSNRLFIVQKGGTILVYDQNYTSLGTFLTVSNVSSTNSEEGLLSMAFHPDYFTNGYFWVLYTNSGSNLELARYKVSASNPNIADAASKQIVLTISHPFTNHNGGELHFGSDGYLYWSTGDGGSGNDPGYNGQNTSTLLGKILRINVSTGTSAPYYTVPADNPFGNEVFVYGLRNPFRWEFDRHTKDMWIGDVGQDAFEEIDFLPANEISGKNLGWRCYEANNVFNSANCNSNNYTFPVFSYPLGSSRSIMGGTVYRGYEFPNLKGYYLAIDYFSGNLHKTIFNTSTNQWNTTTQDALLARATDFGESESGEIFITRNKTTNPIEYAVYKVTSTGPAPTTYVFTGSGNWNTASNWKGNSIPPNPLPSGSQIVVKPRKNGVCNLNQLQTINPGADIFIEPGSNFEINSNLTIME